MPLSVPHKGEEEDAFIGRCNHELAGEYPEASQRNAICYSQWRRSKKVDRAAKSVTRYFLDTEFIEDGRTIDLLSIGIVCEDGRELYMQSSEADQSRANDWVNQNVLPHLEGNPYYTREEIKQAILDFCDPVKYGELQLWGDHADYDWVALCQLFGRMVDLPEGWPKYCMDIKQWKVMLGNPEVPEQQSTEHNALEDARGVKAAWDFLNEYTLGGEAYTQDGAVFAKESKVFGLTELLEAERRKGEEGPGLEDYLYLLHHVHTAEDGEEVLHHCPLLDHLGNKYSVDHIADEKGDQQHCISGLANDQDVYWSDEEAKADGQKIPCANRQLSAG